MQDVSDKNSPSILSVECLFHGVGGIIDWAAAIGAAATAASTVISGASMAQSFAGAGYSVVCTIEVENWTKYPLVYPHSTINGGLIANPPVPVLPGQREQFVTHKTAGTATGTYGTASWLMSAANRRAVVMWSCPYNFNHYVNWLGVGLTHEGTTQHQDWYDAMYYKRNIAEMDYTIDSYYYHTRTITVKDSKFEIVGTMGTSHKAKARIVVRPLELDDLAGPLRDKIENSLPVVGK